MIQQALTLAVLSTVGFMMIYQKLPRKVRRFLEKHSLMTDAIALLLTYAFLGGTLTALMAGSMVGILTSVLLEIANNPEDWLFVYDARDFISAQIKALRATVNAYGVEYRERKLAEAAANAVIVEQHFQVEPA